MEFNGVSHCESLINFHHCSALKSFQKYFETVDEILRIFEIYLILMKFLGRNVICEMKINEGRKEGGVGSPEERLLLSFSFAGCGTIRNTRTNANTNPIPT